ncbi:hypothetical protein Tco_1531392 [Tanacetum coccineum]
MVFTLNFINPIKAPQTNAPLIYLEQPIPPTPTLVPPATEVHADVVAQEEGQSVSSYVLKMKGYLDRLERLGNPMPLPLGVSLIITSLFKEYEEFVQNYNMHSMGKTIVELHAMLRLHEKGLPKKAAAAPVVLAIRGGKIQKNNKYKK